MPDWTYQPILRSWLFLVTPYRARDLTLAALERLASTAAGRTVIHAMGFMTPPEEVQVRAFGITFPGPVGLGAGLDVNGQAAEAFAMFGTGFLELGPVTEGVITELEMIRRWQGQEALGYPSIRSNDGVHALAQRLKRFHARRVPLGVRLGYRPDAPLEEITAERCRLIEALRGDIAFFTVDLPPLDDISTAHLAALVNCAGHTPLLVVIHADEDETALHSKIAAALECGVRGVVLDESIQEIGADRVVISPAVHDQCVRLVRWLRGQWRDLPIIAGGGIHEPADALALLQAGATLVTIHSGLVFTGPGLPKRINEVVAYHAPRQPIPQVHVPRYLGLTPWKWLAFLAAGLMFAGLVIWWVAVTRVILPYDEEFVGMTRDQLAALNVNLLPFMEHDRISFTGVVLASSILLFGTAAYGIRRRVHWAQRAVAISAAMGFSTFFLFLGFGYLDPLHALLTAGLLPAFLFSIQGKTRVYAASHPPSLHNDRAWRLANWGQLFFAVMGLGLLGGGLAIVIVGVTTVFVPQDLAFMDTTADFLRYANPRLLPLIAHDRVGFGGALMSTGLLTVFLTLWGMRKGERWLWWTLVLGGIPAMTSAIGTHFSVGYTDFIHLLPVYLAAVFYVLGAVLTYPYLCGAMPSSRSESGGAQ